MPRRVGYTNMATVRRLLAFPLPRRLFPELKPEDVNIVVGRDIFLNPDYKRVTIPPSIPGDAYINFWGYPGLVYLFLLGCLVGWLMRKTHQSLHLFLSLMPLLVYFALMGVRGQPYEIVLQVVFLILAVRVILWLTASICRVQPLNTSANSRIAAQRLF